MRNAKMTITNARILEKSKKNWDDNIRVQRIRQLEMGLGAGSNIFKL